MNNFKKTRKVKVTKIGGIGNYTFDLQAANSFSEKPKANGTAVEEAIRAENSKKGTTNEDASKKGSTKVEARKKETSEKNGKEEISREKQGGKRAHSGKGELLTGGKQQCVTAERQIIPTGYDELSAEELSRLDDIVRNCNEEEIVAVIQHRNITVGDLQSVLNDVWVNDQVIDAYLLLVTKSVKEKVKLIDCSLAKFIQQKMILDQDTFQTQVEDLYDVDTIIMPLNIRDCHWIAVVIKNTHKMLTIFHANSLERIGASVELKRVDKWLKQQWKLKFPHDKFDPPIFMQKMAQKVPAQLDGNSCGVFTMMFIEHRLRKLSLSFDQSHIPFLRQHIAAKILRGEPKEDALNISN